MNPPSLAPSDVGAASVATTAESYREGRLTWLVVVSALLAALGGTLFGYDTGASGAVTTMPSFQERFFPEVYERGADPGLYCRYDDRILQVFGSTMHLCAMVSSFSACLLSRWTGRLPVLTAAAVLYLIGVGLQAGGANLGMLFAGRAFIGLGAGLANAGGPVYVAEVAPSRWRGALGSLFQLCITGGILLGSIVALVTRDSPEGWRITWGCAGAGAVVLLVASFTLPESPNSLLQRGRLEEGRRNLQRLRGEGADVELELADLQAAAKATSQVPLSRSFKAICSRPHLPALLTSIAMPIFQQLCGIVTIEFYLPNFFSSIGKTRATAMRYAVIVNAFNCGSTFFSIALSDHWGRRPLLIIFGTAMAAIDVVIAVVLATVFPPGSDPASGGGQSAAAIGVLVCFCAFILCFACSYGPLGWLLPAELNGLETRAAATSITTATNFLFMFVIAQSFLTMLCTLKWGTFLFFGGCIMAMGVFVLILLPETRGVPAERVRTLFVHHPVWSKVMGDQAVSAALEEEAGRKDTLTALEAERGPGKGDGGAPGGGSPESRAAAPSEPSSEPAASDGGQPEPAPEPTRAGSGPMGSPGCRPPLAGPRDEDPAP